MKGDIRFVATTIREDSDSFNLTHNYHPTCFSLPRKYSSGATKMTAADFVDDILMDRSLSGEILPTKRDELIAAIETKATKTADSSTEKRDGGGSAEDILAQLKAVYEARK
jgi:hypothetical protein